jgi:NhaP-type Na+/H+ or K+/H+ antiporter
MLPGVFVLLLFLYSLASRRLEGTVVTAPIVFTVAGVVMLPAMERILRAGVDAHVFLNLAEFGLVLLLFTDASRTELAVLKDIRTLPARLLSFGMLLTILLGAVVARVVLPQLSLWEAGILSAILAPTDAGLGQIIVQSPRVPMRIRQALNVEAGLNDGLAVPFLLFFIALAGAGSDGARFAPFVQAQLGYGVLIGAGIGRGGGWLLGRAQRQEWMAESFTQIGVVALPLLCLLASEAAGASMFIAAFVAGLAVQVGFRDAGRHSVEFAEQWGQLLNLAVFFLFGMLIARDWTAFDAALGLYAVLSLTIVRMVPVAISLAGSGLSRATVVFIGWFGPRGLASIVLGLVYLEQESHLPGETTTRLAVMMTVLLSIFAHGLSAGPGIDAYARRIASLGPEAPENQEPGAPRPVGEGRGLGTVR